MKKICIIQNCPTESPGNIIDYFEKQKIPFLHVHSYRGEEFPEIRAIDATIVMGTPVSAMDYDKHEYLKSLFNFMSEAVRFDLPIMGICFGGQLLSMVLGGEVKRNPVREIGIFEIRLTESGQNDSLFIGFDKTFKAFQWHADTFSIPPGAEWLAEDDLCKNQAFRKGRAIGLQFHFDSQLEEIPRWCDQYHDELREEGLSKEKVISDFSLHADMLRRSNSRLLDNFLAGF